MRMSVAVGKLILWEPIIKAQYLWIAKKIAILNQMKAKDDNIFYHYEWNGQERQKGNA